MASDEGLYNTLFVGSYINPVTPLWLHYTSTAIQGPDLAVSTLTVNPFPAGNILLQTTSNAGQEFNAPLIFQRPSGDINAPSESLNMNLSEGVPTYPIDGNFITATKAGGTAYDDIAVKGLQIFGDQTTTANNGAAGYITRGPFSNTLNLITGGVYTSSLITSSLTVDTIISSGIDFGFNFTASQYMSTPVLFTQDVIATRLGKFSSINVTEAIISTAQISTANISTANTDIINSRVANFSSVSISTVNTRLVDTITISSIIGNVSFQLMSTFSLFGNTSISPNVNLGLGNTIQGLIGGAASQGLGVVLGGAALVTGAVGLITGRTSGGVNSNVFQTINGSTQLQFSTIASAVSSVFLTTNSLNPGTVPGTQISTTIGIPAGTYCIRSVGDPLYLRDNFSAIQMFGEWVPVSTGTGGVFQIPSTIGLSTVTINGNLTQTGNGTASLRATTVTGTLATTGNITTTAGIAATGSITGFNLGVTANVAAGSVTTTGNIQANGNLTAFGTVALNGQTIVNAPFTTNGLVALNAGGSVGGTFNTNTIVQTAGTTSLRATTVAGTLATTGNITTTANMSATGGISAGSISAGSIGTSGNLNVLGTASVGSLATTAIQTNNINTTTINNQAYPPTLSIASTIGLSTVTINGNLIQSGNGTTSLQATTVTGTLTATGTTSLQATTVTGTLTATGMQTTNINTTTINNQVYPPTSGTPIIPSTIALSSITFNGNQTQSGNGVATFGLTQFNSVATFNSVGVFNGTLRASGPFEAFGGATMCNSVNVLSGGIVVTAGNIGITSGNVAVASGNIRSPSLSTINISTATINNLPYVPFSGFPSTLALSTVSINGGLGVNNGNLNVIGGLGVSNGVLVTAGGITQTGTFNILAGGANISGAVSHTNGNITTTGNLTVANGSLVANYAFIQQDPTSSKTIATTQGSNSLLMTSLDPAASGFLWRRGLNPGQGTLMTMTETALTRIYNTLTIRDGNPTSIASIQTYQPTLDPQPYGMMITSTISTNTLAANAIAASNLTISSINNSLFSPTLPTGAVTIWAGGSETTVAQNFNLPTGWLVCDGSLIQISTYPNLAAVIGTTYSPQGSSPPVGFVFLPDLTFAVVMGTPRKTYSSVQTPGGGPTIQIEATTSDSFYNTGIGGAQILTLTTLRINAKTGGALNYGSFIPSGSVSVNNASFPAFPAMYVSSIIQYGGKPTDTGYVLLRSCDDLTPIPRIPITSTITAVFQGVAYGALLPGGVDAPYKYGTANVTGNTVTTRNQGINEVAAHNHQGVPDTNSTALFGNDLRTGNGGFTSSNYLPYVDNVGNRSQNLAYYTAPNFINMVYIIKA